MGKPIARIIIWFFILLNILFVIAAFSLYLGNDPKTDFISLLICIAIFGGIATGLFIIDRKALTKKKPEKAVPQQTAANNTPPTLSAPPTELPPRAISDSVEIRDRHRNQIRDFVKKTTGQHYGATSTKAITFGVTDPTTRERRLAIWAKGSEIGYLAQALEASAYQAMSHKRIKNLEIEVFVRYSPEEMQVWCIEDGALAL